MPELNLDTLYHRLVSSTNLVQAPQKPQDAALTAIIADLHLHPTLEALLHILNHDLPSAHFLVRHMQAPPAVEGMLLHGILHRAEGDFNNARAWMSDVSDACAGFQPKKSPTGERLDDEVAAKIKGRAGVRESLVEFVYAGQDPSALTDEVEAWRRRKGDERTAGEIEGRIRKESERVLEWCGGKFGRGEFGDATRAWVRNSEEINKMSGEMVSGGKGYREF